MKEQEIWKDIEGYSGVYQISSYGNIRSLKNKNPRILKPFISTSGYWRVNLYSLDFVPTTLYVHRLVASYFVSNNSPTIKNCVNHKDGDKKNNNKYNLEWTTFKENSCHARDNGLLVRTVGDINGMSKLSWDKVAELRKLASSTNLTYKELGKLFGVNDSTVCNIINNKSWVI